MNATLEKIFRLRRDEVTPALVLGGVLFLNAAAMQISSVASISGFLSNIGVPQILLVWIADFAIILLMSAVQSLIVDRVNRVRLIAGVLVAFLAFTLGIRLLFALDAPPALNYSLLYLLTDQQWLFLPAIFWVLAADIFSMSQAKRLFPIITALGLVGKLCGLGLSLIGPSILSDQLHRPLADMLWINVLIYAGAFALITLGLRKYSQTKPLPRSEGVRATFIEGFQFIRTVPMFRYLTISVMLLVLCATIIEFNFLVNADHTWSSGSSFPEFFATYRIIVILISMLMQGLFTSRLIERIQLKNAFLILPIVTLIVSCVALLRADVRTAILAMLTTQIVHDTMNNSASKSLQSLVPEDKRGRVGIFMDSYLTAAGTIFASLVLGALLVISTILSLANAAPLYIGVCLLCAALANGAILFMRSHSESSMLNWRLTRRKRATNILNQLDL